MAKPKIQQTDEKMGVEAYCVIKGEQKLVGKLIKIRMAEKNDTETEKTFADWDALRDETMNQVAK